jgi:hypothetical protein
VPLLRKGIVKSFNATTLPKWRKGRKEGKSLKEQWKNEGNKKNALLNPSL